MKHLSSLALQFELQVNQQLKDIRCYIWGEIWHSIDTIIIL